MKRRLMLLTILAGLCGGGIAESQTPPPPPMTCTVHRYMVFVPYNAHGEAMTMFIKTELFSGTSTDEAGADLAWQIAADIRLQELNIGPNSYLWTPHPVTPYAYANVGPPIPPATGYYYPGPWQNSLTGSGNYTWH